MGRDVVVCGVVRVYVRLCSVEGMVQAAFSRVASFAKNCLDQSKLVAAAVQSEASLVAPEHSKWATTAICGIEQGVGGYGLGWG